jgi:hypothetical protein
MERKGEGMEKMEATRSSVDGYNGFVMSGTFVSRSRGSYMDDGGPKSTGECQWPMCPGISAPGALLCTKYHVLQNVAQPLFDVFVDAGVGWSLGTVEWEGTTYESLIFDLRAMR